MFKTFSLLLAVLFSFPTFAVEISKAIQKSTDRIVKADTAEKQNAPFICLECGKELTLKKGKVLAPHFAHKKDPNSTCTGGGPETWQHRQAKELIVDHLNQWKFVEKCPSCEKWIQTPTFSTDSGYEGKIEHPFERFKVDVMIVRGNENIAAIEIRHTHAVDAMKNAFFLEQGVPIVEVDASQVIRAHERGSYQVGYTKVGNCRPCEEEETRKNLRRCLDCGRWQNKNDLSEIEPPQDYKYPTAFACNDCLDACPSCGEAISRQERQKHHGCRSCGSLQETVQRILRSNRIELAVPYADKDSAKACGARWDMSNKLWYTEIRNMRRCSEWIRAGKILVPMIERTIREQEESTRREQATFEAARIQKAEQARLLIQQQQKERQQTLERQREAQKLKLLAEEQQRRDLEEKIKREEAESLRRQQEAEAAIQTQRAREAQQIEQERQDRLQAQRQLERQREQRANEAKRKRKEEKSAELSKDNKRITEFFKKP